MTAMGRELRTDPARRATGVSQILLKNSKLPKLANQIASMRQRHCGQRLAGPTAIESAPASLCVALSAIDATRATFELQLNVRRSHV